MVLKYINSKQIDEASLYLGNVSKDFLADNMKKTVLYWYDFDFSVDYDVVDYKYWCWWYSRSS